jgi:hypothetical protein
MKYVCIFTRYIYGHSGNELPPPVENTVSRGILSVDGESEEEFRRRMTTFGMLLRSEVDQTPRPYSAPDGWDWAIHQMWDV